MKKWSGNRGATFGTYVISLIVLGAVWGGIEWFIGYFGKTKAEQVITQAILNSPPDDSDEALKEKMLNDLSFQGVSGVEADKMQIFRSKDNTRIQVKFPYIHRRDIPLTGKALTIPYDGTVDEALKASRGF